MTLDELGAAYDTAITNERLAFITARHAALEHEDAKTKLERAARAWAAATLTPEQARYREWQANRTKATNDN